MDKKSVMNEFKEFALEGNMLDLAIGVIIGASSQKVVSSLVNDVIMPPIGLLLGKINFSDLYINLSSKSYNTLAEAQAAGAPTLNYGLFVTTLIEFFIITFLIFLIVKQINRIKRPQKKDK